MSGDSKLPLDLTAQIVAANGTRYTLDVSDKLAANRLLNASFTTKLGEGFSSAQGQLARRIDSDDPDLRLMSDLVFVGADGSSAWEGRIDGLPREVSDTSHRISVQATGWMAHARDRQFTEIYVDRDLSAWGGMSLGRQATLLTGGYTPNDASQATDVTTATSGIVTSFDGAWSTGFKPVSEAWYDAGPGRYVGKIVYSWLNQKTTTIDYTDTNWQWTIGVAADDTGTSAASAGNLRAASPGGGTYTPTSLRRYAFTELLYNSSPAGADAAHFGVAWYNLAVYGAHGLTTYTGEPVQPPGVYASDVIKDIAHRFCPQLDTSGVQSTSYVIQHLTFKDLTDPYDAFLQVNKYHLWQLAVWEDRKLVFAPYTLDDYDWEIRLDDPGVTFSPQGQSIDDLATGVTVSFTDALTGVQNILTPDDYPDDLQIPADPDNPFLARGVDRWFNLSLSTPSTAAQALQLGRTALADKNRPKTPGTITVKGYVRDRYGSQQPCWRVRAGDTISISNFADGAPRLIVETSYDVESKAISLSIDLPFALIDAYFDRLGSAVQARGLT